MSKKAKLIHLTKENVLKINEVNITLLDEAPAGFIRTNIKIVVSSNGSGTPYTKNGGATPCLVTGVSRPGFSMFYTDLFSKAGEFVSEMQYGSDGAANAFSKDALALNTYYGVVGGTQEYDLLITWDERELVS